MAQMRSAVVAGSKGFVDAVQGHIKMRFGAAPRVARDPAEACRACADGGDLLVLEYAGSPWLEAVKSLRGGCGDAALSIVAAVPLAQASDVQPLQRAGVDEVVSWQGRVDPVMWAVDRVVGRQSAQLSELPLLASQPSEDVEVEKGFELREIPAADAPAPTPIPVLSSAPRMAALSEAAVPEVLWPDAVPSAVAAEALLLSLAAGRAQADAALVAAAERALGGASELERAALAGADVPVEAAALRGAAAMRLRLDIALSTAPTGSAGVDQPAAQQLVADVDGVLGQLKALAAAAPAGVAPAIEPIRLAVVDGGVKLAGALSQLVPEGAPCVGSKADPKPSTRLLSNQKTETASTASRRQIVLWVFFAVALAGSAVFHGWRHVHTPMPSVPQRMPGAPEKSIAAAGPRQVIFVTSEKGRFEAAEIEKFKAEQELKGNTVKQVAPGTILVYPRSAASAKGVAP